MLRRRAHSHGPLAGRSRSEPGRVFQRRSRLVESVIDLRPTGLDSASGAALSGVASDATFAVIEADSRQRAGQGRVNSAGAAMHAPSPGRRRSR